jgi:hypothetical protein
MRSLGSRQLDVARTVCGYYTTVNVANGNSPNAVHLRAAARPNSDENSAILLL